MSKSFKFVYYLNAVILIIGLLYPIIQLLFGSTSLGEVLYKYYLVFILLSITFCVSFFVLNIYGAIKYRRYKMKYYTIAILFGAWIIWGMYQIAYGYLHDIVL